MTNDHRGVFEAALALPERERASLVEKLLESLSPELDELTDEEFFAELERRRAEIENDPTAAIPWTDVVKGE
ncbi:MAG TPA: addiction module protein [Gemmataceae bacterium]|jgi:putative addiction module component (TIGR02574 family)|nr:addiction module protein [Gemmataceae bacterium]